MGPALLPHRSRTTIDFRNSPQLYRFQLSRDGSCPSLTANAETRESRAKPTSVGALAGLNQ